MMAELQLRVQHVERTWSFELLEALEKVLENDYVIKRPMG